VIALAILSVGLVGAMRVFPVGLRASQRSELHSRAAFAAQRVIESLKLKPWEELTEEETTAQEDGFDVVTSITAPELDPLVNPDRVKAVEVTVRINQAGRSRDLRFITYLRRESS
jgi:hypothetical protein